MNAPLSQAAAVTVRMLLFRAGPQDFPHAPQFVVPLPLFAAAAYFMFWSIIMPAGAAVAIVLCGTAALGLVTLLLLRARGVANRFQQTYHALLATTAVLALAMVLPASVLAPTMKQIMANPELLKDPAAVRGSPAASMLLNLLYLWTLGMFANIFRHALNTWLTVGMLVAVFVIFSMMLLTLFGSALLSPLVQ